MLRLVLSSHSNFQLESCLSPNKLKESKCCETSILRGWMRWRLEQRFDDFWWGSYSLWGHEHQGGDSSTSFNVSTALSKAIVARTALCFFCSIQQSILRLSNDAIVAENGLMLSSLFDSLLPAASESNVFAAWVSNVSLMMSFRSSSNTTCSRHSTWLTQCLFVCCGGRGEVFYPTALRSWWITIFRSNPLRQISPLWRSRVRHLGSSSSLDRSQVWHYGHQWQRLPLCLTTVHSCRLKSLLMLIYVHRI